MNKYFFTEKLLIVIVVSFIFVFIGCQQPVGTSNTSVSTSTSSKESPVAKAKGSSGGSSTSSPVVSADLLASDIETLYSFSKNAVSAYEAVCLIKSSGSNGAKTNDTLSVTKAEVVAYDDAVGTFSVKFTGKKGNNAFTDKQIDFTGYTNPWMPNGYVSVAKNENAKNYLVLDDGIKENLPIAKFIEHVSTSIKTPSNYSNYFAFYFSIPATNKTVSFGETNYYKLEAVLVDGGDGKINITPNYTIKQHSSTDGKTDSVTAVSKNGGEFYHGVDYSGSISTDYFTKKDVFDYILKATEDTIINKDVVTNSYASYLYGQANQGSHMLPEGLLDADVLEPFRQKYVGASFSSDKYLKLESIDVNIYNYNITPDDYNGTLKFAYCIGTSDDVGNQANSNDISISSEKTLTGFKTIKTVENVNSLFSFFLIKSTNFNDSRWKKYTVSSLSLVTSTGSASGELSYTVAESGDFNTPKFGGRYLMCNSESLGVVFRETGISYGKVLQDKTWKTYNLVPEYITMTKQFGSDDCYIDCKFFGVENSIKVKAILQ